MKGIVGAIPSRREAFRGYTLHINLETLPKPAAWIHRR